MQSKTTSNSSESQKLRITNSSLDLIKSYYELLRWPVLIYVVPTILIVISLNTKGSFARQTIFGLAEDPIAKFTLSEVELALVILALVVIWLCLSSFVDNQVKMYQVKAM